MSDHDRGAYTPQPDAPLQFDARGPSSRRPLPMTLIGSAGVLVVLVGALALHYQHGARGAADPARPVGEPIAAIKTAAPAPATTEGATAGADVYAAKTADAARIPTFAPPPEAPAPRPAPHLTVQIDGVSPKPATTRLATTATTTASAAAALPVVKTLPAVKTVTTTTTTATVASPSVYKAPAVSGAGLAPAKPTAVASSATFKAVPVPKAATTGAASGPAVVQIGAYSSTALADKGYGDVSTSMSGQMGGKTKRIEALDKDGSTLYRTSVVGFASKAAASTFCEGLKAKGKICFVKG